MVNHSTVKLQHLIDHALLDKEIQKGLEEVKFSYEDISSILLEKADEIFRSVSFSKAQYERAMLIIDNFIRVRPSHEVYSWKAKRIFFDAVSTLLLGIGLSGIFFLARNDIWHNLKIPFFDVNPIIHYPLFKVCFALLSMLGYITLGRLFYEFLNKIEKDRNKDKQWAWVEENRLLYDEFLNANKIRKNLLDPVELEIIDKSIKELIRSEINQKIKPSYAAEMDNVIPSGLSEVIDLSKSIDTSAKKKLEFLINNMPGGSIGIAGSRGAGKSTLIKSFCLRKNTTDKINGKLSLPVFTTSPVHYNSREFILHLFYSTCKSVLIHFGTQERTISYNVTPIKQSSLNRLWNIIYNSKYIQLIVGIVIMIFSYFLWTIREQLQKSNSDSTVILYLKILLNSELLHFIIATIGFMMTIVAFLMILASAAKFIWGVIDGDLSEKSSKTSASDNTITTQQALVEIVQDWIMKIRFQQTFTSGWSGGINASLVEASTNTSSTFSENAMSNPEIVASFTQVLNDLSRNFQVIIGIDELDKLDSALEASTFLNELKSIFGIPGCFFLISVSENAINSFERRGLPFRDVFDSSFDSIVYVEHLNLKHSQTLLQRRVIGRPVPFFALAYCLSAGLPRDIIRYYREIIRLSLEDNNLYSITRRLLSEDLNAKLRAMMSSLSLDSPSRMVHQLGAILNELQAKELSLSSLNVCVSRILDYFQESNLNSKDKTTLNDTKFERAIQEIIAYLLYLSTVWSVFSYNGSTRSIKDLETDGFFDRLAAARQAFYTNLSLAIDMILTCRKEEKMVLPEELVL